MYIASIIIFLLLAFTSVKANDIIITNQPQSIKECVGKSSSLSVSTYSLTDKQLSFQWYKDNLIIPNENTPLLKFPSLQHNQSGTYYCEISNSENETIKTNFISVYALTTTSITKQPEDIYTSLDNEVIKLSFKAHVSGILIDEAIQEGEFVSIQWYRVTDDINTILTNNDIFYGVNSSELSINLRTLPDTTYYFAEILGKCGNIKTRTVSVIKNLFLVQLEIDNLDACERNIESIKSYIINTYNHNLEFQWYKDGKPIYYKENLKGIFSDELIFNPIFMKDAGRYKLEAKIKEMNYSVFSNEVDVIVGKEPKIVCVRIDTLYGKNDNNSHYFKNPSNSWLNIFFEENSLPIQFDIYRNGELIATKFSDSSVFSLGNIFYLDYIYKYKDSSLFWVIAHNKCGYAFSDTISLFNQVICDPLNQFHNKCVYEPLSLYLDYKATEPVNQLDTKWITYHPGHVSFIPVPIDNNHVKANEKKLELLNLNSIFYIQRNNNESVTDFNTSYYVLRRIGNNNTTFEAEFCCFYLSIGYIPIILRQPVSKQLIYGENDTIIYIHFDNEFEKKIEIELYYMASLNNKPRLVDKSEPDWGRWYVYKKDVTFAEDGYYYAVSRYDNDCEPVISDTVRVTVIPNGSTTSINNFDSKSGLLIQPNPASDFITIKFETSEVSKVQIFDILGIEIMSVEAGQDVSTQKIDVSHLPTGMYFIRIGNKVEKFVKM